MQTVGCSCCTVLGRVDEEFQLLCGRWVGRCHFGAGLVTGSDRNRRWIESDLRIFVVAGLTDIQ